MLSAAPLPLISVENVQAALDSLRYASTPVTANALQRLMLVERALADPAMPSSALSREIVLTALLVNAVRDHLSIHRATFELLPPDEHLPLTQALAQLQADGRLLSPELSGWSILFYRYVCVTLDLSFETLAEALMIDVRTARRYQAHAVHRLAKWLTEVEREARQAHQRLRLVAHLPTQVPLTLIGQDVVLTTLDRIRNEQRPFHVLVTGSHGIGKTAVVQEYVRSLIERNEVDQVIWIENPPTVEQARRLINDRVVPEDSQVNLREYLQLTRALVVVDDGDTLLATQEAELPDFLNELSAATVFMIAARYLALPVAHAHVVVPELSEDESIALTRLVLAGADESADVVRAFGQTIWRAVGGNPLLIRLCASTNQFFETLTITHGDALDQVYGHSFTTLDRTQKRALLMVVLCPAGEVSLAQLAALWPSEAPHAAIETLIARSLLDLSSRERGTFLMIGAARRFLQGRAASESELRALTAELLSALEWQPDTPPVLRDVFLHLLRQNGQIFPEGWRSRALHRLAHVDIPALHRAQWRAILEDERSRAGRLDALSQMAYAVSLRRASDWSTAIDLLADVIRQTGMSGQFLDQAHAMLELAVLYRYRGEYNGAKTLLVKAEKTGRRFHDSVLLDRAHLELAQIEVDVGDGAAALRLLENVPLSLRRLALSAEALFLDGDAEQAIQVVNQALALPDADQTTLARLHSITGRGFEAQGKLDEARDRFVMAVTLLEQAEDPFALARARSNLASVRIKLDQLTGVAELLRRAEAVQRVLGDRTGLLATRHNQRLLAIRSSR